MNKNKVKFFIAILWCGLLPAALFILNEYLATDIKMAMGALYFSIPVMLYLEDFFYIVYKAVRTNYKAASVKHPERRRKDVAEHTSTKVDLYI